MCATQFMLWNPSQKMLILLNGYFQILRNLLNGCISQFSNTLRSASCELRVFVWAVGSTHLSLQIESFRMKDDLKLTKFNNTKYIYIQSASPTPHQNSLFPWCAVIPGISRGIYCILARECSLMKTIYCATGAFLSYIECLCTLARAKI